MLQSNCRVDHPIDTPIRVEPRNLSVTNPRYDRHRGCTDTTGDHMTSDRTQEQLSFSYGEDRHYYQALMLREVFNSRVSQRMQAVLVNLRGRQRPRT